MSAKADLEAAPASVPAPPPAATPSSSPPPPAAPQPPQRSRLSRELPQFILMHILFFYEFLMIWPWVFGHQPINEIEERVMGQLPIWTLLNTLNIAMGWAWAAVEIFNEAQWARGHGALRLFAFQLVVFLVCSLCQVVYGVVGPRSVFWW